MPVGFELERHLERSFGTKRIALGIEQLRNGFACDKKLYHSQPGGTCETDALAFGNPVTVLTPRRTSGWAMPAYSPVETDAGRWSASAAMLSPVNVVLAAPSICTECSNDAYSSYVEMGRPAVLTDMQLRQLQGKTSDEPAISAFQVGRDGTAHLGIPMRDHDVVMVEMSRT